MGVDRLDYFGYFVGCNSELLGEIMVQVFGIEHIIYLVVAICIMVTALVLTKLYAKSEKAQGIIVRVTGGLLLCAILWNRISISLKTNPANWMFLIPESVCGMTSLLLSLALIFGKRDNIALHYLVYVGFIGGLITMIYPDFLGQADTIWYQPTISGLIHHTLCFFATLLVFVVGWFRPDYHKWYAALIGFMTYITLGAFFMSVLGMDSAFYINKPALSGTIFNIWMIAVIFMVVYAIFMFVVEAVRFHKRKKECIHHINVQLQNSNDTDKIEKLANKLNDVSNIKK